MLDRYVAFVCRSKIGTTARQAVELWPKIAQHLFFRSQFNVTGQPAISLPLHWTPERLPVGVQLVAAMCREDLLIHVVRQLEQAQPWSARRPLVHACTDASNALRSRSA